MIVAFAQQFHATADNFMAEKLQAAEDELAARDPDDLDIFTRAYLKQKALQNGNDDISISDDFMNRLIKIVVEQLKDMVGIDEADKMSNSIYARYLAKKN